MAPIKRRHWLAKFLESQPDVEYVKFEATLKPVRHFLSTIVIYDHPNRNGAMGAWTVAKLWAHCQQDQIDSSIGPDIPFVQDGPVTLIYDLPKPVPYPDFQRIIETQTLPFLRSINSIERLHDEWEHSNEPHFRGPDARFRLEPAMGNFTEAQRLLAMHRQAWLHDPVDYFEEEAAEYNRQLCRLLDARNFSGIGMLLQEWEGLEVERRGVAHLWQPSPFPFEEGYGDWLASQARGLRN